MAEAMKSLTSTHAIPLFVLIFYFDGGPSYVVVLI